MKEKEHSKLVLISLIIVIIIVLIIMSITFTLFVKKQSDIAYSSKLIGKVSMRYTEDTNGITITDALPVTDKVGMAQTGEGEYFDFSVGTEISSEVPIQYEITAVKDKASTIDDKDVKIYLEKQQNGTYVKFIEPTHFIPLDENSDIGSPIGTMVLKRVETKGNVTDNYRLKMWINKNSDVGENKYYSIKINVYAKAK